MRLYPLEYRSIDELLNCQQFATNGMDESPSSRPLGYGEHPIVHSISPTIYRIVKEVVIGSRDLREVPERKDYRNPSIDQSGSVLLQLASLIITELGRCFLKKMVYRPGFHSPIPSAPWGHERHRASETPKGAGR